MVRSFFMCYNQNGKHYFLLVMVKIAWSKILDLLLPLSYWAALLVVPLSMSYFFPIFSPFTLIKTAWLQIIGASFLVFLIFKLHPWSKSDNFPLKARFWRAIAPVWLFWGVWVLLSVWSLNPLQTWFGSYDRQLGLWAYFWLALWFSFIVYYFGGFRSEIKNNQINFWQQGIRSSTLLMAIVGTIVGVYAFLQFCGYDFAVWQETQLYGRAIATLGQPNFLGSFLLLCLPLTVYYFSQSRRFFSRFLIFLMLAAQIAGLVVSGSRAAWLAAIIVLAVVIIFYLWRRWRGWSIVLAAGFILTLGLFFYGLMPARLTALRDFNTGSVALRRYFYQASGQVISEHLWSGTGLDAGGEALVAQYRPDWGIFLKIDGYTDLVHNRILDIIIQTGLIGFVGWLFLCLFWLRQLRCLWTKPAARNFTLATAAALGAYSLSLFFGLADIASLFYVWVIAALVVAGNTSAHSEKFNQADLSKHSFKNNFFGLKTAIAASVSALLILFSVFQIYFSLSSLQADYYFLQLYRLLPARQYFTIDTLYSYSMASELNPVNRAYYQRALSAYVVADFDNLPDISSRRLMRASLAAIAASLPQRGYENFAVKTNLLCLAQGAEVARADFQKLISLSPARPLAYRDWGRCLQTSLKNEEALVAYGQALALLPPADDLRLNQEHRDYLNYYAHQLLRDRGSLYQRQPDYPAALHAYKQAYSAYPDDFYILKNIAEIYSLQADQAAAAAALNHFYLRQPAGER